MVRPRSKKARSEAEAPADTSKRDAGVDVNVVVSYNLKAIRKRKDWTQQDVAERLAAITGQRQLPQASISAMEGGFVGNRRRRFDAQELYQFSVLFDVPIVYFFIPPPNMGFEELANTRRPLAELYSALLGREHQLEPLDERLAQINVENPEEADHVLASIFGADDAVRNWHEHFRTWRKKRLAQVEREYGDRLDEVAEFLAEFANKIKLLGPKAYLQSTAHRAGEDVRPKSNQAED